MCYDISYEYSVSVELPAGGPGAVKSWASQKVDCLSLQSTSITIITLTYICIALYFIRTYVRTVQYITYVLVTLHQCTLHQYSTVYGVRVVSYKHRIYTVYSQKLPMGRGLWNFNFTNNNYFNKLDCTRTFLIQRTPVYVLQHK